jgi:glutamate-1-semialdehyde aminotransferase
MGADSLFLLQASQAIRDKFGVKLPFRMMLEEYSTVEALSNYIGQNVSGYEVEPDSANGESQPAIPVSDVIPSEPEIAAVAPEVSQPSVAVEPSVTYKAHGGNGGNGSTPSNLERIFAQQLQIMSQQLEVLGRRKEVRPTEDRPRVATPAPPPTPAPTPVTQPKDAPKPYVAYRSISEGLAGGLTPHQQEHLNDLIARLTKRTKGSKHLAEAYRHVFADNRGTAGFRLIWKEMQYALVVKRAEGSRVWDIDGNEYVDLTMGFGALLFGHSPSFLVEAMEDHIKRGVQLGGSSQLAPLAAELIRELTGCERASFCNSGTEAVMGALRLARTVTGRSKIAVFEGGYHGTFDGILVRGGTGEAGRLKAIPLAPGVPQHMIDNIVLLSPDDPNCADKIREHKGELAAVLLEPLQNRRPDMKPGPFLKEMRRVTDEIGAALIFDEVVSGFRFHPGGAQAVFGVQADLVTYGKAVGAGLPVGVVAGKAEYMDPIDGGAWNYGDDSYPRAETTFFTGTYFKHPMIMAGVYATLKHLKESGPRLQEELNERTAKLVNSLNTYFNDAAIPIRVAHFASLFRFIFPRELNLTDIFYYHMLEQGVYIGETRNCLYSTAHTDADADFIFDAVERSVSQMREGGFLGEPANTPPPRGKKRSQKPAESTPVPRQSAAAASAGTHSASARRIPLTEAQQSMWSMAQLGGEASCAYNQFFSMRLRGTLDLDAMRGAIADLIDRHEALRITIDPTGEYQQVRPSFKLEVPLVDLSTLPAERREAHVTEWLDAERRQPFDLVEGPLIRARILRLEERLHVLCLVIHHIVTDGWSNGIIVQELSALYSARAQGVANPLPPPAQYSEYVSLEGASNEHSDEDETYWLNRFADRVPVLEMPLDHPRPPEKTFNAGRERLAISNSLYEGLKRVSAQQRCTMFMTVFSGFTAMIHKLSKQDDIIVGITAAGQLAAGGKNVVGYCINLLPIRSRLNGDPTFAAYLAEMKQTILDAHKHQRYPFRRLLKKLNPPRDPSRMPMISVTFNLDKPRLAASAKSAVPVTTDLQVELLPNSRGFLQWELFYNMVESDGHLHLECDYNTDLFNVHTVRRWMQDYLQLLEAAVDRPLSSISSLARILTESNNRARVIEEQTLEKARVKKFGKLKRRSG